MRIFFAGTLGLGVFFSTLVVGKSSKSATPMSLVKLSESIPGLGSQISVSVRSYVPPLWIKTDGSRLDGSKEDWFQAWYCTEQVPAAPWSQLKNLVSDEFLKETKLNEAAYDSALKAFPIKARSVTIYYTINLQCDSGEYLFVVQAQDWGKDLPRSEWLGLNLLKKIDGGWRQTTYPFQEANDGKLGIQCLPWNNVKGVEKIQSLGRAQIGSGTHVLTAK